MNQPYPVQQQNLRALQPLDGQARIAAFRAASRHTRAVRTLKIAIPAVAVAIGLATMLASYFNPLRMLDKLPVDISSLSVNGTKITMEKPHLAGFTKDSRAYEVHAGTAAQDLTRPTIVELTDIRATLETQDKDKFSLNATTGEFDTKAELLTLDKGIVVKTASGYEGFLKDALVEMRKGRIVTDKPVTLKMLQGTLDAQRMEVSDNGNHMLFSGGIAMTLMLPNAATPGAAAEKKSGK